MPIGKDTQQGHKAQNAPYDLQSRDRPPHGNSLHTAEEIKEIVIIIRLNLYNRGLFCGAQVIRRELEEMQVKPLPSLRTINRILNRQGLTHQRTGHYAPLEKHSR